MAATQEGRLGLYYNWSEPENFADQMDNNILVLAFLANPAVINKTQTSAPASPADVAAYIVAAGATGIFAGGVDNFAV